MHWDKLFTSGNRGSARCTTPIADRKAVSTGRLAEAGIEPSVGSVGDSYEFNLIRASGSNDSPDHSTAQNAQAETINGLFKAEVIHRRGPWRSFDAVEYAALEWVDWFNTRRPLEPIGNIPPAEAKANFHAALETETMAA